MRGTRKALSNPKTPIQFIRSLKDRLKRKDATMRKPRILAAVLLAIALNGCGARVAHVTNLPAGVTEQQAKNYDAAVANLHKIALITSTARQTIINLRNQGITDDAYLRLTLPLIAKIDEAELAASAYLRDAPEYFAEPQKQRIRDIFANVLAQIEQLNSAGVTGIKNPDSLKQVNGLLTELAGVVNLVLSLTSP